MISDFKNKKIYQYLKEGGGGRVLFIFNHGIGDLINFLSSYERLKELFPNYLFKIGTPNYRKNQCLYPDIISLDDNYRSMIRYYRYIFRVSYPEPTIINRREGIRKPYLCNIEELGIPNFVWKPFRYNNGFIYNKNSNLVGVHFTGNSNPKNKNIDFKIMEKIWKEIEEYGFIPFEVHMDSSNVIDRNFPDFINESNSLRFEKPDLELLMNKIKDCRYFLGVDSGPLYLSCSILGVDKCIFLKNMMDINWYFPYTINEIDTKKYKSSDIKRVLQSL